MDGTTNRQHGLQADRLGFLVGQRRIERITGNIHQDTQEIVRLLKGMLQDRVLNPPDNQVQGLAAAIAISQRQATIDIVAAIRELSGIPIATRPTVDVGGSGAPVGTGSSVPPVSTRPTVDVRSDADLTRNNPPPITDTNTPTPNTPDSTDSTPDAAAGTNPPPSVRTDYVRDSRGRFVPRNRAGDADGASGDDATAENTDGRVNNGRRRGADGRFEGNGDSKSWFDKFKNAVSGGVSTGMADTQGVDPTVDAINELGGLLSPMKKAAGFAFKPISMLMKRNKRSEPLPADQERHNRDERRFWGRLVDAITTQTRSLSGMGGLGMLRMLPLVIPAVVAAVTAYLAKEAVDKVNEFFDEKRPEEQGDINPDGSTNKGVIGAGNRFAKRVMNGVRGAANSVNAWLGGDNDYFDDGTAPDSVNRIGLKTDAVNQQGGVAVGGNSRLGVFAGVADAVGFGEGDYNSVNRGTDPRTGKSYGSTKANLSEMTINQVLERNKKPFGDPDRMNAVGKYQIIASTMKGLVSKMGLTGEEKLTPEMQDRLFMALMPKATTDYVSGRSTDRNAAITGLAKEYASIGVPVDMKGHVQNVRAGQSFYHGYGGNKANPQSLPKVAAALDVARAQTVGKPTQPATPPATSPQPAANQPKPAAPTKLPETSNGLAQYAETQPAPAVTVPVPAPATPTANTQSMIRPAAQVMSLPISASSARQAPNLPTMQPMPKVKEQVSSPAPQVVTIAQSADTIAQNVGDRAIAHAVTGGLGMRNTWEG